MTTPTNPCSPWTDTAGNFDFLAYLQNLIETIECGIEEGRSLGGTFGIATMQHLQLANSQLRSALAVHITHNTIVPPQAN